MNPRRRKSWFVVLVLLAGGAAAAWFERATLLEGLGRWLDVGGRPQHVDYVMFLPGDHNSRPFVAAAMYRAGLGERIVTAQPVIPPEVREGTLMSDSEIARRVLQLRGVPDDRVIVLEGESRSTFDDAQALRAYLREEPACSIAVVTSDFHTRRSRWTFEQVFDRTPHLLSFVSAPTDEYHAGNWWHVQGGITNYASEFAKLPFYWFYYHPAGVWLAGIALLALTTMLVWRGRRRLWLETRNAHA